MFELEDYHCPNKKCPGVYSGGVKQRAQLEYVMLYDFYQCPECGTEVWEPRIALMGGFQGGRRALFTVLK